ncbi:MAG TPA: alpha/beta fold hydrolase, partial [Acidimicrobiia bacterium]|nr:alpha/beta fold hydrolase [Acidimicrobiia bacterium]
AVELVDASGEVREVPGRRLQALLARLVSESGQSVSVDALVDAVWPDGLPDAPDAALQTQVYRLRKRLRFPGAPTVATRGPGYALELGAATVDAIEFEREVRAAIGAEPSVARARLEVALACWRGAPYAGFEDVEPLRAEQIRLDEIHLQAIEAHAEALLAGGDPNRTITELDAFVSEHPLRADAQATLMRALAATGRDAEALRVFQAHRHHLGEELGLEPSPRLRRLEASILRGELVPAGAEIAEPGGRDGQRLSIDGLSLHRLTADAIDLAWGELGGGSPVVVVPAWLSNLAVIADGRDPRSALIEQLATNHRAITYDRCGTGLTGGAVRDFGVEAAVDELEAVLEILDEPAALFAMSGAGPIALACAARRPDLVSHLVLFGTYASGPKTFGDVGRPILDLLRQRPNIASELLAGLYRPGASGAATLHFARILRDSAAIDVAAGYLEAIYDTDVSVLLDKIRAPALVLHYRGDRVIPFAGGEALAAALRSVRFIAKDGAWHLPDARDVDGIIQAVEELLSS